MSKKDNLELVETLLRLHNKKDLSLEENFRFFQKISDRLGTAKYEELHFGLSDMRMFEYLTMSYFMMQSDDIFQKAYMGSMFKRAFQKLSSNRFWKKRKHNKKYDLLNGYQNGIRRSKNWPKVVFHDSNLRKIKLNLPLLGKENVIGYVVNQEHLGPFDIRLIDAVLNKDNKGVFAVDTLENILKQNNWPCKNVLELYLRYKKEYGF